MKSNDPAPNAAKSNRGGKRAGAGRKPKGYVSPTTLAGLDLRAALEADTPETIESDAQRHARAVVDELYKVIIQGQSDSARVAACNTILDRGYGKPSVDTGVDMVLPFLGSAPSKAAGTSAEIRAVCRKFSPLAVEVLNKIASASSSESARVAAAKSLLDRGLGTVAAARLTSKDKADAPPPRPETSWDTLVHH